MLQVPDAQARCHTLLHARGAALHAAHHVAAARELLASALFYSPPGAAHARTARLLAACCAALGQEPAALEYLLHAARHDAAGCAVGRLLELRVLLALQRRNREQAPEHLACQPEGQVADTQDSPDRTSTADRLQKRICAAIAAVAAAVPPAGVDGAGVMKVRLDDARGGGCTLA